MKNSLNQLAIQKLYDNRQKFILIGLTGRTGSGCTSAAKILSSKFQDIKLPQPYSCQTNEDRKYKIIYKFSKKKMEEISSYTGKGHYYFIYHRI